MGENDKSEAAPAAIAPEYPPQHLPVAFADGVKSISWGLGVVKFYFHRYDPDMNAKFDNQAQPVAQVVMPIAGFLRTSLFFQRTVEGMVKDGTIPAELMAEVQKASAGPK